MKQIYSFLYTGVLILSGFILFSSCANIIPPGGGPRDSLPPRLVMALPKDSALNVTNKNITLTFDEFVTLQNPQEAVIISPYPSAKGSPLFDYKLRNVTVKLKDSLEPNTTYSLDFGDAIRDVNEGNIARSFRYIFSTGNKIDYNTYSGKVILSESGRIDSTLLVVLHKNLNDTAILKDRPRYFTRVNGKGEFKFHNLPEGDFAVYVIEGQSNFLKRYDDSTRMFAFRNSPVTINPNTTPDTLYAFEEFKRKAPVSSSLSKIAPGKEDKRLKYTIDLDNGQQDLLSNLTLTFNRKLTSFDSTGFALLDTSFHKLSGYSFSLDTGKIKVVVKYKWKESTQFRLLINKDAVADSAGTSLTKADSIRFITRRESDYGSLRIRFANLDLSKNPVLQIVVSDRITESVPLTQSDFIRKMFAPGTYDLRILYDANKNGIWDTGHFKTKKQPEVVQRIPRQLTIKGNWDNEVNISL
jgi:hypothetical protein